MKSTALKLSFLFLILTMFTSCEAIGDIFKAGMGVGIFIVIAVVAIIIWIISRFRK
jgi:TRAP-type C4-dicarboxylate transport system permease large subunit